MTLVVNNLPANAGDIRDMGLMTKGLILAEEHPWGRGMATHYSILAWRNPWTKENGRLHP